MITVTVSFANGASQQFTLDDGSQVLHLKYQLITTATSPLYQQTTDYADLHVAYQASQDDALVNVQALVQGTQYFARLPVPQCSICQNNLTADITTLGCGHRYHRNCIAGWIGQGRRRCPVCNTETIPNTLATINVYSGTTLVTTAAQGTFTLDFTTISLTDPQVAGVAPGDNGTYSVTVATIGGVTPDNPYQLPLMRYDITQEAFAGPMILTRV